MSSRWQEVARAGAGPSYAEEYARRFADGAARGDDVHGEARFVASLLPAPARILDAGCGTGRVAVRLAALGYDVTGVDVDADMLAVARRDAPHLTWHCADLADLVSSTPDGVGDGYDVVLLAGNVVPLADEGTLPAVAASCAAVLADGGVVVAGFGLDADHLPAGCPVTPLDAWDAALAAAGLVPAARHDGWDAHPPLPADRRPEGYVVAVHRRGGAS